ncbi:MAG TPA: aminotransferase class V-fold PLP-dependent enzyme [Longimicrobiales bacterium]|nr:aminotransferase class V-fold PLP-dependent enzyme [Longimicrobiales bacterium]
MSFDPGQWRADTAAASAGRIHLNNAGAALMPRPVVDAVTAHLELEVRVGGYEAADSARADIEAAYEHVGRLVGAGARNIAVVENATAAFAQALSAFDLEQGDVILTTRNDYISNQLALLSLARRRGVRVVRAEDRPEGGVDPESVRRLLAAERPRLATATWVPTNSGLVQPVAEVGALCADAGVPYIVDACQAVGQIEVDVEALQCDFLCATARKFLRGPRGVGFLYVSDAMLDGGRAPLWVDMRGARWTHADAYDLADSARRFENWEFAYALVLGMGAAARYALEVGVGPAGAYAADLARRVRDGVAGMAGARVLDRGPALSAIATVAFDGHDAGTIVERLREQAINTSATYREYAVLDMDDKRAASAVRISPHYYNTVRDVDTLLFGLEEFAGAG